MPNISLFSPQSGQMIKENGQIVNVAEMIEALYNSLVVNKNAGMQLTGRVVPITETQILANQVINAGAQWSVLVTFDAAEEFAIGVRADTSHAFKVQMVWTDAGGSYSFGDDVASIIDKSDTRAISSVLKTKGRRANVYIINSDTVQHTYNVFIFRVRR